MSGRCFITRTGAFLPGDAIENDDLQLFVRTVGDQHYDGNGDAHTDKHGWGDRPRHSVDDAEYEQIFYFVERIEF